MTSTPTTRSRSGASSAAACTSTTASTSSSSSTRDASGSCRGLRYKTAVERHRRRRADERLPVQRDEQGRHRRGRRRSSPRRRAACGRPASTESSSRARTGCSSRSSSRRRSTRERTSTAALSRTGPASRSRSSEAIRAEVGADFCLGFKISVDEAPRELLPWMRKGNCVDDVVKVCRMLERAGVDYLHVSAGTGFPHPRNPAGRLPGQGRGQDLRRPDLQWALRAPQLRRLPHLAAQRRLPLVVGAAAAASWASRASTSPARGRSRTRCRSPCSARAASRPRP